MGKLIAIDKLYMNKIPNSCKECPLTYLDTGDDAYFGANERRCVIDDSCIDGMVSERAYDCPLVEAIPKDQYEARLKADMVAILTEIQLEIEEEKTNTEHLHYDELEQAENYNNGVDNCNDIIQQKINSLKSESEEQEPTTRHCFGCKYSKDNHNQDIEECHLCMWENQYTPTTKNDCAEQNGCITCSLDDGDDCCRKLYEESMQDLTTKNDIRDNRVKNELNRVKDELEPTTKNCESCRYYGSHHEVCNYCYKCSLWTEKELTTKNDLGVDWESYKDVDSNRLDDLILDVIQRNFDCGNTYGYKVADEIIGLLPSATPQEPRKGHWIDNHNGTISCSYCQTWFHKDDRYSYMHYCPNCITKMTESEEV